MDLTETVDTMMEEALGKVKDPTQAEHLMVYIESAQGGPVQRLQKVRVSYDERAQPFLVLSAKR